MIFHNPSSVSFHSTASPEGSRFLSRLIGLTDEGRYHPDAEESFVLFLPTPKILQSPLVTSEWQYSIGVPYLYPWVDNRAG